MFTIHIMRADHVIWFAAEELKKYLRMMMPECGDIEISYNPEATEGFRLGLGEDFGLKFQEALDPLLDDVVHIDTHEEGGILAGSNPRSVLFAVYRYLKENGCRWLFPGVDGEFIPIRKVEAVSYHHLPGYRFRGHCNEGAESQQCMLETIDFYAKQEINTYMLEFDTPYTYYNRYYRHMYNQKNRGSEPVSPEQVKQWKRQCEAEIAKRGLQFHDMGHGWTAEPFGLNSVEGWTPRKVEITDDVRRHLALVNGKRELWGDVAMATQLCMSNPDTRTIFAKAVVDYARRHQNVTYLHVALGDATQNFCECEECRKLRPSDYYVMILNEIDELLTKENLNTRIVFSSYHDTGFAPLVAKVDNPERFALLYAPIRRSYTSSLDATKIGETPEFVLNNWKDTSGVEANAAFLLDWQKSWHGCCLCYEYHYWIHLFRDPGIMSISRRIYEDILSLKPVGIEGFIEDGTQRGFFPNGFPFFVYAETLLHSDRSYEEMKEDYFSHVYGERWREAAACLEMISDLFDYAYMEGEGSVDSRKGKYYNPPHVEDLKKVHEIAKKEKLLAMEERKKLKEHHEKHPKRAQMVAYRLLEMHAEYCCGLADIMIQKAQGNQEKAKEMLDQFCIDFGKHEVELERYYDHFMMGKTMNVYMTEKQALF